MLSPVIWTTVATGVEPSRHGILDFLVRDPVTGDKQPVTSVQRKAATVWEMLGRAGAITGVVVLVGDMAGGCRQRLHGDGADRLPAVRFHERS